MTETTPSPLGNVITIDDERIKNHLDRVVRGSVEETLNALLDAEADRLCNAHFRILRTLRVVGESDLDPGLEAADQVPECRTAKPEFFPVHLVPNSEAQTESLSAD